MVAYGRGSNIAIVAGIRHTHVSTEPSIYQETIVKKQLRVNNILLTFFTIGYFAVVNFLGISSSGFLRVWLVILGQVRLFVFTGSSLLYH